MRLFSFALERAKYPSLQSVLALLFLSSLAHATPRSQYNAPTRVLQKEVPFESFEELKRTKVLKQSSLYVVQGHTSAEDGAGGIFVFQTHKPLPEVPGVTYEIPGKGYLVRQGFTSGSPIRAEWFGAKGDGVTDDRAAIQSALDGHSRVNLMAKVYGLGKGLYIGWCNKGSDQNPRWEKCLGPGESSALTVKTNYRILGTTRNLTTIRLLNNTNPRTTGGVFDIIGNPMTSSAANVEVRDLTIDVNFDGQSKAIQAPDDSLIDPTTGHPVVSPNTGEVATLNAIRVYGPNARFENLRVIGYSSNTFQEAFVVSSGLVFKDSSVGRQCATIRNVEMTSPGSNLEIKYRRFGGAAGLKKKDEHVAEITHIAVAGAHNFTNQPYGYGAYSIPSDHPEWQPGNRREFLTMRDALNSLSGNQLRPASAEIPKVIEVTKPEPVQYRFDETSETPANNLTVFAPHKSSVTLPRGRLVRLDSKSRPDFAAKSESGVIAMVREMAPNVRHNKIFEVEAPSTEYYRVDPSMPGLEGDGVRIFISQANRFALTRIQGDKGSCDAGWGCDPSFDPTYLGENAANAWSCEGGVIENVYIHDEVTNPQGLSADGTVFGLSESEVKGSNGSHVHGISVALTNKLIIRGNRVENFMGPAVFIMSWWNDNLVVRDNHFDGVLHGVQLVSMTEGSGRPFQFARHHNIAVVNNFIRLAERSNTYRPSAFRIHDQANGSTFIDPVTKIAAMPSQEYPRFENIRFAFNRVVGRPVLHGDKRRVMYPLAIDIESASHLKNIRVWRNSLDMMPDPRFPIVESGSGIQIAPGHFYQMKDESRHSIAIFDNTDLQGKAGDRYISQFKDLSIQPSSPATTAYPMLVRGDGVLLGVGEERT